ncbi:hypothetical protein M948_06000 [Virgibacillus sp. CM-4]|uniref:class I SAM-dependent methyltransferase n=1 Tax=Virgibacillus sp. CM-4 TaxID=1354277 RepID=UPI00038860E6|nr:methyltransferase domain-containing protein [Virgibacillus sp. CM-4]EQB38125.1 hypothetical protein M948_06000 [Virgibacillus sp. CM-4]
MVELLDRISEAYFDNMGSEFGYDTRKRIHWICEHAQGEGILDVGCSQGVTSILLARESKYVLGIDVRQESIDYANSMLNEEVHSTKKHVEFQMANFIDYEPNGKKFDTVIFGEILEHLTDPKRFLQKAMQLLTPNGRVIITVPFGINDFPDHKRTYYLKELIELQIDHLSLAEIKFFGRWIGVILKYQENDERKYIDTVNIDTLRELEENFYLKERSLINEIDEKKKEIRNLIATNNRYENKIQEQGTEERLERNKQEEATSRLLSKNESLRNTISSLREIEKKYKELQKNTQTKVKKTEQKFINEKKKKVESDKKLLQSYTKEEKLLKNHAQLLERYDALKNSKLGRLQLKYWQWRRQRFGGKNSGSKVN